MKSRLVLLFLISILLAANPVLAESKILLRLNLQKAAVYEMTQVITSNIDQEMMGQKMKIDQKMEMVFNFQGIRHRQRQADIDRYYKPNSF